MAAAEREEPELTVYSRRDCHLCDEMITGLQALQARFPFTLSIVDVDSDSALVSLYGTEVPVLVDRGRELCRHALAIALVTDYLAKIG